MFPWRTLAFLVVIGVVVFSSGVPEEKRISIYSIVANYSLPVNQWGGNDYVGLLEVLEPLGTVSAKASGNNWKLVYNGVESVFTAGGRRVHVRGSDFDLPDPFWLVNGRGLVPLSSLGALLPRILGGRVIFNEAARRVFIGNVAVHFTAQVLKSSPPKLVMNFTSPVNPTVATEPGKLRMTFSHEAVVAPGSPALTFDSSVIPSATFQEKNGAAELLVSGTVPLLATFSNDGRTITIGPPPVASTATVAGAPPKPPTQSEPPVPVPQPAQRAAVPLAGSPRYFAVIDPAHGGDERGAALNDQLAEKDVTLAIARSLRQELMSRGLPTTLVRDGDVTLTAEQRASTANAADAAVYICIHASSEGRGVRLYTSLLPPAGGENRGPLLDWGTAQAAFRQVSEAAADGVAVELKGKQISTRTLAAALRPMNNLATAAFAVEVAPSGNDVSQLSSSVYQQTIAAAVASGIADVRDRLKVEPK